MTIDSCFIYGPAGKLEANYLENTLGNLDVIAIICHPHPLHGGTMNNKVVTTLFKELSKVCVYTIKFNYRGVGKSAGSYAEAEGEFTDCVSVLSWARNKFGDKPVVLAGFSFGAYVSLRTALVTDNLYKLISIAPAVHHHDYESLKEPECKWLVIIGDQDELVPREEFEQWVANREAKHGNCKVVIMKSATHFFHGKLVQLQEEVRNFIDEIDT